MSIRKFTNLVSVNACACIWMAFLILVLPLQWITAAVIAAVFHELGHVLLVYMLGGKVVEIVFGINGIQLIATPMRPIEQVASSLAGPTFSFLLMLLIHVMPRVSLCGLVQGTYNLLPLRKLDGGRALWTILCKICGFRKASTIFRILEYTVYATGLFTVLYIVPCMI